MSFLLIPKRYRHPIIVAALFRKYVQWNFRDIKAAMRSGKIANLSKPLGKPAEDLAEIIPIASFGITFIPITSASFILIVILPEMQLNHLISISWEINTVHV